jgi:hypothetical protein
MSPPDAAEDGLKSGVGWGALPPRRHLCTDCLNYRSATSGAHGRVGDRHGRLLRGRWPVDLEKVLPSGARTKLIGVGGSGRWPVDRGWRD